ncbi:MAG: SDR family oxidoreductase [Gammaproteobacteria bacterium]|jgi:NAD(P)-dependent dehydrogenase (short-subunit alcohol dehydrogenase family)|nr:SDR family oxidoreductase [Gammaproteobacteria bacterium]
MNVVITGAGRGIGLGFVEHYLAEGAEVWACVRSTPAELAQQRGERLHIVHWDVREPAPRGGDLLPERIDLLINNAGIWSAGDAPQGLEEVTPDTMLEVFDVDCVGALRVVQHTLPALGKARGVVANMSSRMGSSGDNTSGSCYAYRAAKAALVIVSKSMAIDLAPRGVRVITLHPGWVRTDMTDHSGLIDVAQSVAGLARVIDSVGDYPLGAFVAWDGQQVPY